MDPKACIKAIFFFQWPANSGIRLKSNHLANDPGMAIVPDLESAVGFSCGVPGVVHVKCIHTAGLAGHLPCRSLLDCP